MFCMEMLLKHGVDYQYLVSLLWYLHIFFALHVGLEVMVMMFSANFNNISVISIL
jgi:hypothetical protein